MRALVTGGAGFIGSHVVDHLLAQGAAVLVVDDLSTGTEQNLAQARAAELVPIDIGSPQLLDVARAFRPDAIVHCAAQASVVVSMREPVRDAATNIVGGLNVRDAALACSCAQLVYLNTGGALYGHPDYLPMDEDHPVRPQSGYGLSKWTLECYLKLLPSEMPLKVLRLANIYGPRQDPYGEAGVVSIFSAQMARGEPPTIFGDGEQTRDFVYVGDVVRAIALALAAPASLTVNISSGTGTSVNGIFRMLAAACGYTPEPVYAPERPGEVRHSVLANDRAKRMLGWQPETTLPDGLRATLDWVRTHPDMNGDVELGE